MKTSSSLRFNAAPVVLTCCLLAAGSPRASAQQSRGLIPVANPAVPEAAATPARTDAAASVENPPPAEKAEPNASTETEILATEGADFASKERIAVFKGDVRVNDPRFQLACDKLTVFLARSASADGAGKGTVPAAGNTPPAGGGGTPAAKGAGDDNERAGGIDHARADGHVIIIQKRPPSKPGEEGKTSIGRSDWAEFDNKTGDVVLHGTPRVEQNGNTHIALSPSTVMTLHKDNSMNTVGPSRTVITERGKGEAGGAPAAGAGPQGSPSAKKHPRGSGAPQG